MEKRHHTRALLFICWMAFVLIACNLGTSEEQPILEARPSPTPAPTIGYSPLGPAELPGQAAAVSNLRGAELLNLLNEVETDRLIAHIGTLQSFHTRHVNSPKDNGSRGIGAAQRYIESQFEQIQNESQGALQYFTHPFELVYNGETTLQHNVVATITGTEPNAGVILLGAHYDSVYLNLDDAEAFAPGADDNGSGVAILIELARILSKRPHRMTIMFVAFSAEEVGRVGSRRFVEEYIKRLNIPLVAMFNLDTLGSNNDKQGNVQDNLIRVFSAGPDNSPSRQLARMVNFMAFNYGPGTDLVIYEEIDREGRYGDHESFSESGYAAIRFIESLEEHVNGDPEDIVQDIEPAYLAQNAKTLLAVVTAMADGPRPPRNISLRDVGGGLRRVVWEPVPDAVSYVIALRSPGSTIFNQQFEVTDNFVDWDGFNSARFVSFAVAAKDANGLIGPLSAEYTIP